MMKRLSAGIVGHQNKETLQDNVDLLGCICADKVWPGMITRRFVYPKWPQIRGIRMRTSILAGCTRWAAVSQKTKPKQRAATRKQPKYISNNFSSKANQLRSSCPSTCRHCLTE